MVEQFPFLGIQLQVITKSNFLGNAQINQGVHTFKNGAEMSMVPSNDCFLRFHLHV